MTIISRNYFLLVLVILPSVFRSRLTINQLPNVVLPQTEFKVSHKQRRKPLKSTTSIYVYKCSYLLTYSHWPNYVSAAAQTVS